MTLVGEGFDVRIAGDAEGRASIAYARLDGHQLVLDLPKSAGKRAHIVA